MKVALRLARRGVGCTSPNPMVGAVLVKHGRIIGRGWHHRAGEPHAEIEALRDAERKGHNTKGAILFVTLEPCCTRGRTPACTDAIIKAGIRKVVAGATDPNPKHCGRGFRVLKRAGIDVETGVLEKKCLDLNEAFNHWVVHHTPFVTVKAAMTLDGKIATVNGQSKWITGPEARAWGMKLRAQFDAILVGINTILADDPLLTFRSGAQPDRPSFQPEPVPDSAPLSFPLSQPLSSSGHGSERGRDKGFDKGPDKGFNEGSLAAFGDKLQGPAARPDLRRIILDTHARTPLTARVVVDDPHALTTIVVGKNAPGTRVNQLARHVRVLTAPTCNSMIDLRWLLKALGAENVTSLLVEGGGEVNASFLFGGFAHRVTFFYAPKILGGRFSRRAVAGDGAKALNETIRLQDVQWCTLGLDRLLTARCSPP